MRHLRIGAPSEFKSFFGRDVEFAADTDEIVLSDSMISLPVVRQDTHLNTLLRQYAEEALARRRGQRASVRSEVERILAQLLPHGTSGLSEVAGRLGMSSRTLQRRLRDEGVAYAKILDQLRNALARRYLSDLALQVSEIAWLLGYREVSSFTHAFRKWSKMTPRQFRSLAGSGVRTNLAKAAH
jgi:AraC-like DNA-binding protein